MIQFDYYLVTSYVGDFPLFTTCAEIGGKYFRISDLKAFSLNGKDGISDEEIIVHSIKLITSKSFTI